MKHFRVYWLTCVLTFLAVAASATTIVLPTDEQLVVKSPLIVEGTVISSAPVGRGAEIWTETRLVVEQTFKGTATGEVIIREIGGQLGDRISKIYGAPEYRVGQRVLAFLAPTNRGDFQTVDLFIGKFAEERTVNGRRLWTRNDAAGDVALLDANFEPIAAKNVQRDAEPFEAFIRDRVAGRKPATLNYGLENPVLERDIVRTPAPHLPIQSEFTLISEPTIYRWFAFQNGTSARWFSFGTQPGYAGGGVNEIQTAMAAWNGYSGAKINYTYAGVGTGSPGGLSGPNGVNEVLFNDPKQEISGTFNPSTGGVVGQGGFNGVSGQQSWTATFAADGQHPAGTLVGWNITEGNLTIQDGVTASSISSATLAEIVAHEFGHTLGLGHSADNTALMYATLTRLGPSLRADDQLAARWLYPNGSSTPPPPATTVPAAPTSLTASATSSSTIGLQWADKSSNETGFYVYIASGGGFSRISGSVGANQQSANLTGVSPGATYQIYITAFNSAGESAPSNTASVTIPQSAPPLTAAFAISQSSGIAGSTVFSFYDQSSGTITSRMWNFGDGTTASATNPTHVFANAGIYAVTLTVSNGTSQQTAQRGVTVTNSAPATPPVAASFDFSPSSPTVRDTVSFFDRSTGSPTSWSWSFGDGLGSSVQNPTHLYPSSGSYLVALTVSNATTSSTTTRLVNITRNDQLLLNNSRFLVSLSARDQRSGKTATGQGTLQTPVFGYFSLPELTGSANIPEVFVKVVGPVNGSYWVFFGGLTDVEYTLTVQDTMNGSVRTYHKDPGTSKGVPAAVSCPRGIARPPRSLRRRWDAA